MHVSFPLSASLCCVSQQILTPCSPSCSPIKNNEPNANSMQLIRVPERKSDKLCQSLCHCAQCVNDWLQPPTQQKYYIDNNRRADFHFNPIEFCCETWKQTRISCKLFDCGIAPHPRNMLFLHADMLVWQHLFILYLKLGRFWGTGFWYHWNIALCTVDIGECKVNLAIVEMWYILVAKLKVSPVFFASKFGLKYFIQISKIYKLSRTSERLNFSSHT
jgi:hypothetical protein